MKAFALVVDEGAWPDVEARIHKALRRHFGAVRVSPLPPATIPPSPTVRDLVRSVAFEMGLQVSEIVGECRQQRLVRARYAVIWLASTACGCSLASIGRSLGYRDHSTVIHGLGRAGEMRDRDPAFRMLTDRLALAIEEKKP